MEYTGTTHLENPLALVEGDTIPINPKFPGATLILDAEHIKDIYAINHMSREYMARFWRYAPSGHPYFDTTVCYYQFFEKRFLSLGGFSPAISKKIGWGE